MAKYKVQVVESEKTDKPFLRLVSANNGKTMMHGEILENVADARATAKNIAEGEFTVEDLLLEGEKPADE